MAITYQPAGSSCLYAIQIASDRDARLKTLKGPFIEQSESIKEAFQASTSFRTQLIARAAHCHRRGSSDCDFTCWLMCIKVSIHR